MESTVSVLTIGKALSTDAHDAWQQPQQAVQSLPLRRNMTRAVPLERLDPL